MKPRKFFHVSAIVFSSLMSLASHGHAKADMGKKPKNSGESSLSKSNGSSAQASAEASDEPPKSPASKLDPALMATAQFSTPALLSTAPERADNGGEENTRYPWRKHIVTTTFWIGEDAAKNNPVPNRKSSWDTRWAENYGGTDDPKRENRAEYMPAAFTPGQNPFYIALPYNDLEKAGHKAEASRVIPWFHKEYKGPGKSVLKGRWVAIRFKDKVCYAQWEDCGPFRTDHWQYVFGNERPKPNLNRGAGLDVSPAVRDYLGMNDTDVTDWRFVDFDEVPQGPWAKVGANNTFVQKEQEAQRRYAQTKASTPVTLRN
jgi:hypothetical protein